MTFTSGQVLTAAQLNDLDIDSLTVDTNVLVVDKTNNRVGVNTASPGYDLSVGTPSGNASVQIMAASGAYPQLFFGDGGTNQWHIESTPSGGALYFIETGVGYPLTILPGNKVGVGETTPRQRFHVNSGATNNVALFESTDSTAWASLKDNSTSGDNYVAVGAVGNEMRLRANNANRVTLTGTEMNPSVDVIPGADNTYDLGSTSNHWAQVHAERYYTEDSDTYIEYDGDSGSGIDGPGIRFYINNSEMFKFCRENNDAAHSMLQFGENNDGILYEKDTEQFNWYVNGARQARLGSSGDFILRAGATFKTDDSGSQFPTGTGDDARIVTGFGLSALAKYSSVLADKENVSTDLGTWLTADMVDSVTPKMWNRIQAPGYPEIGPIAEDMDAISPFLSQAGTDINGDHLLTGINKVGWMSLLTLAIQDLRTRVAALES